ncbi:hypothetical protein PIROE2DRAFT_10407 [Piromyces sp. E2]|nr:hypothetical protein PIROE2DRAFT_10407 [Piromyces sp. E2]|eukprot:OUM63139.1 hypothetical protein PIROE2DRAFT_10407 [Piromyces sp. E2]
MESDLPPMAFKDKDGNMIGFDIDLAKATCDKLGVKYEEKIIDWSKKEDELNSGNIDCIWDGMSYNTERANSMNLSDSYLDIKLVITVKSGSIKSVNDLKGKKVGVQKDTTSEDVLKKLSIYSADNTVYDEMVNLLKKLEEGQVDAVIMDDIVVQYYINSNNKNNLTILPDILNEEKYVIGFRKNDGALRNEIQNILNDLKKDGTTDKIYNKWFGKNNTSNDDSTLFKVRGFLKNPLIPTPFKRSVIFSIVLGIVAYYAHLLESNKSILNETQQLVNCKIIRLYILTIRLRYINGNFK